MDFTLPLAKFADREKKRNKSEMRIPGYVFCFLMPGKLTAGIRIESASPRTGGWS
ncbi:MAG TPA: hypothetical protein PK440_08655 [Candidatus Accumulibacter phosphatis]|nr:hypothetical protein [Candidatus Accumulibacter phosphatis]HRQ95053.1 hypothetical protein [Candidatus Accumulibacter phosphatis]